MSEAPKEIWISPTNYRWWTSPCEDLPLLHRYIHAAESKEAADRIEQLEAENAELQNALEHERERKRQAVDDALAHLRPDTGGR